MSSTSPTWSTMSQPPRKNVPTGFRAPTKPQPQAIEQLSHRELHDLWNKNKKILSEPSPSTSTYHQRIIAEQAAIEATLGMSTLESSLLKTHISQDVPMDSVPVSTSPPSRTVEVKRRAIGRYHADTQQRGSTAPIGLDEAMELEQRAHVAALDKQKLELEKRVQRGLPLPGEVLTREEREARIWAFMNAKPSESDEDDEDWDVDEDDDDPSTWFEDDEDDGRKGQPLVDPDDPEELSRLIRVDDPHWG